MFRPMVRGVLAFYVILALLLGVFYSWKWIVVVALVGALPAFSIWAVAGNLENFREYYGRRDREDGR
jgi:hypothetical protein